MSIDDHDRAIMKELQRDGRISNVELASRVHLSESACLRRLRALETSGLIERYAAIIDPVQAGVPGNVFVHITLASQEQNDLQNFEEAVRKVPEVMECYLMSGEFDYLVRVVITDTADFERLHAEQLTRLPGVARVQSSFALRSVCKSLTLPIR
jgi:Lrp/AsnC family leucine-responsive transcriptional regulator